MRQNNEIILYCCECKKDVKPRLTTGAEVYNHRKDLADLPFWICICGNFVGCHHKTKDRTRPLGCIPNAKIKDLRKSIHGLIDPIWKSGRLARPSIYRELTTVLGREYHTADLRTVEECEEVIRYLRNLND